MKRIVLMLVVAFGVVAIVDTADAGPIGRRIFARGMGKKPGHSVQNICKGPNCKAAR